MAIFPNGKYFEQSEKNIQLANHLQRFGEPDGISEMGKLSNYYVKREDKIFIMGYTNDTGVDDKWIG